MYANGFDVIGAVQKIGSQRGPGPGEGRSSGRPWRRDRRRDARYMGDLDRRRGAAVGSPGPFRAGSCRQASPVGLGPFDLRSALLLQVSAMWATVRSRVHGGSGHRVSKVSPPQMGQTRSLGRRHAMRSWTGYSRTGYRRGSRDRATRSPSWRIHCRERLEKAVDALFEGAKVDLEGTETGGTSTTPTGKG